MKHLNPALLADFYKLSHRLQYPKGTEIVYSTWTPRASRIEGVNKVVVFGLQHFIKEYLIEYFNTYFFKRPIKSITDDYKRILKHTLGVNDAPTEHIEDLHRLGYLPLLIKALPEGSVSPLRVPTMTIQNTDKKFFWLTNYIETLMSCELWQPSTSATIANEYRKLLEKSAMKTVGNIGFVRFQGHDFSMRGMSTLHSSITSGMGHLTSFVGTDTIPAIQSLEKFYNANVEKELIGCSVNASEHSVECCYNNDLEYINRLITEVHPEGIVSIVSDGYDYWNVINSVLPKLKDTIMKRNGKLVVRPDSGTPELIICGNTNSNVEHERKGSIECLWDLFGGTINEKGYKELDSHIGLIYGDAITLERADKITKLLEIKGFASTNVVFGIGSFTYQYNTRDTFGYALKSTLAVINGKEIPIFKDPKTDTDGIKKSQRGRVVVLKDDKEGFRFIDGLSLNDNVSGDCLREVFKDGKLLVEETLNDIRNRIRVV
jgi:nicotinamide phosphoribosyltransferase